MTKQIILTQKGIDSGPYYDVYYSTDGIVFVFSSNEYLPYVGSSVIITIPNNSTAIKLVSTGTCNNFVAENIPNALGGDFSQDFSQLDFN